MCIRDREITALSENKNAKCCKKGEIRTQNLRNPGLIIHNFLEEIVVENTGETEKAQKPTLHLGE